MLCLLLLSVAATPVALTVRNEEGPGVFEVRGADGRVLSSGYVIDELAAKVPPSSGYTLTLRRPGGEVSGHFASAERITSMKVTVHRHYLEVTTWEPAPDMTLRAVRAPDRAASYQLINRGRTRWWAHRWLEHEAEVEPFSCWVKGGLVGEGATLELGTVDEACLLGDARELQIQLVVALADQPERLRDRLFTVRTTVRASDIEGRWVGDAGRLACVCPGSVIGPERDVLLTKPFEPRRFRRADGGVYDEAYPPAGAAPRPGDYAPHIMPTGAETHPDFSGWH